MMKTRFAKILTLTIACLLLIGAAIGISASAETTPTAEIVGRNLVYEGAVQVIYAVDAQNVDGYEVEIYFWNEYPTDTAVPEYTKTAGGTVTIGGTTYLTFYSHGAYPKDMKKNIYAMPVVLSGDEVVATGALAEYSIYTYAMNRFKASPSADQIALYSDLLDYGAYVQKVLLADENSGYTEEDLIAGGGYINQYSGVAVDTYVDGEKVGTENLGYFCPGDKVNIDADKTYEGALFDGYTDAEGNAVGAYGGEHTSSTWNKYDVTAAGVGTTTYIKNYKTYGVLKSYSYEGTENQPTVQGGVAASKAASYAAYGMIASASTYTNHMNFIDDGTGNTVLDITTVVGTSFDHAFIIDGNPDPLVDGAKYIFETDIKWLGTTVQGTGDKYWWGRIGFTSAATVPNGDDNGFIHVDTAYISPYDSLKLQENTLYGPGSGRKTMVSLSAGEWYTIKYEYIPGGAVYDDTGAVTGYSYVRNFYLNGMLVNVHEGTCNYDNNDAISFRFWNRGGTGDDRHYQLDNTYAGVIYKDARGSGLYADEAFTYESGNQPTISVKAATAAASATTDVITSLSASTYPTYMKFVDDGTGNYVFDITTNVGTSNDHGFIYKTDSLGIVEKYVFETDFKWLGTTVEGTSDQHWWGRIGFASSASVKATKDDYLFTHVDCAYIAPNEPLILQSHTLYTSSRVNEAALAIGTWYNLRWEYIPTGTVETDGAVTGYTYTRNLYVNGGLIDSHNGTCESDNTDCVEFRFWNRGGTGDDRHYQLDNTYAGVIYKDARGSGLYADEAFTYDEANRPTIAQSSNPTTATTDMIYYSPVNANNYSFIDDGTGNFVFNYANDTTNKSANDHGFIYKTDTTKNVAKYVFETDFKWLGVTEMNGDSQTWWFGRIGFISAEGATGNTDGDSTKTYTDDQEGYGFVNQWKASGNPSVDSAYLALDSDLRLGNGTTADPCYATLKTGVWYTLRYEYVPAGTVEENGVTYWLTQFKIYVNNNLVKEAEYKTPFDNTECVQFRFWNRHMNYDNRHYQLDNTYAGVIYTE